MARTSIIGPTSVVIGDVSGSGDLEITGRVQGDVTVDGTVHVEEGGVVLGSIRARDVRITGRVDGHVTAQRSLLLKAGANLNGDLSAGLLAIEEGARVRGSVHTVGPELTEEDEAAAAPSSESEGDAHGAQDRPRRERRRRRGSGGGAATSAPPPLAGSPRQSQAREPQPPAALRSADRPANHAAGRPERPGPPAPVVPALAKGVRARRRPARDHE